MRLQSEPVSHSTRVTGYVSGWFDREVLFVKIASTNGNLDVDSVKLICSARFCIICLSIFNGRYVLITLASFLLAILVR